MTRSLVALLLCLFSVAICAQKSNEEHVKRLMDNDKYLDALEVLESLPAEDKSHFLKRGICYYYTGDLDKAMDDLAAAYDAGEESATLLKYLALSHHKRGEFISASRAYKLYLNEIDRDDPERKEIIHAIKNCSYGRKAKHVEQIGFVENLGVVVNSKYDEIAPIKSPNYAYKYYFSSNRKGSTGGLRNKNGLKDDIYGKYSSDIYTVEQINGSWTPSTGVPPLLNSARDEILQGFSDNGRVLIFLKQGGNATPQLVSDTFSTEVTETPQPLVTPANGGLGDKDLFFVDDKTFIFSSKRRGGYGGYDLYITYKEDGSWMEPINLGPEVNSPFDEVSPFLVNSGSILYFSSNREESIGGYDIYTARYGIERGRWDQAQNIGFPVSSPANDMYFRLSDDGRSAIFSSDRKESIGGYDLFIAYMKNQILEQLSFVAEVPFINREGDLAGVPSTVSEEEIPEPVEEAREEEETPVTKVREMVIYPLLYNMDDNVVSGNNAKVLKDILDMMIIYPSVNISLTGHTHNEGSKAYDLYFSVKRAEQAAEYLMSNGISGDRITIYGVGSNYPMVSRQGSTFATRNNNRIEINFNDDNATGLKVTYNYPLISDYLKDPSATAFREKSSGVHFRIMVTEARQMYDNPTILGQQNVIIEKNGDQKSYRYTIGLHEKYLDALELKNEMIRRGFLDIRMKAYQAGKELSPEQAKKLLPQFPELEMYITNELR
jgi:outer membrane protein OmpA-like peptidoglycan-associated protein/tetratricopeptide (TPR) repeat protein